MFQYEIKLYHEKDGEIKTSDYNNKEITDENLDFVLDQFTSNFGFEIIEVKKNGVVLNEEKIEEIITQFPCQHKFEELDEYFHK